VVPASGSGLGVADLSVEGAAAESTLAGFETHLRQFIESHADCDPIAHQVRYHFGLEDATARRGKRMRPRFVMAAAQSLGGAAEATFEACTAIELLHNYSLVHDDIEDADQLRHGRDAVWAAFGMPHGINTGDAIGALAHLALGPAASLLGAERVLQMDMELARANLDMCCGQAMDLALEAGAPAGLDTYLEMVQGKTAALFGCAGALGAHCASASASDVDRARRVGQCFGLAFQIADDVDGAWSSARVTGKTASADIARKKKTFPILWALEHDTGDNARLIEDRFHAQKPLSDQEVAEVRTALERCGAHEAARSVADNYFNEAMRTAVGWQPLLALLSGWRSPI